MSNRENLQDFDQWHGVQVGAYLNANASATNASPFRTENATSPIDCTLSTVSHPVIIKISCDVLAGEERVGPAPALH